MHGMSILPISTLCMTALMLFARLPANSSQELVLKYQLPGHSMEELISLRSNDDLEEFKVQQHITLCHVDHSIRIMIIYRCSSGLLGYLPGMS